MNKKEGKPPEADTSETSSLGIPEFNLVEKITSVVPVKLQPSVKRAIPEPRSAWIRQAIIEKLERMEEETEDFE